MLRCRLWVLFVALAAPVSAQDGAALYGRHCASCHENGAVVRAPSRDLIAALPPDRIIATLETGVMRVQGEGLTPDERRAIAAFVSTVQPATASASTTPTCSPSSPPLRDVSSPRNWNGWGVTLENTRFQREPGLTAGDVPALKLKWAFGFDGDNAAAAQPAIVGRRVFVGSASGRVYSLGLADGCVHWMFKADARVRSGITVGDSRTEGPAVFFGDGRATVYSLDAATGSLRWTRKLDDHRSAGITGSPVLYNGRLYVPVASGEEGTGAQPTYECCTFRGSVVALDAASGEQLWKTYMIAEPPAPTIKNKVGTQLWGPSGAAVWSAPTIDPRTNSIYVATGDSYSEPAASTSDAIVALDLTTGSIKWVRQITEGDAFNMACGTPNPANCPDKEGPDHDFGQPPMLVSLPGDRRALVLGQKSGVVHAVDPDDRGKVLWSVRIGRGGILGGAEWGSTTDGEKIYVPISDNKDPKTRGRGALDPSMGGGLFALRIAERGTVAWEHRELVCGDRPSCSPAHSAPASSIPGVVFSGALDGHMRAYSTADGRSLWDYDTARDFETVNGVKARGGSIDVGGPAIAEGVIVTTSGYGTWGGMRGNVLLAFSPDGK